MPSQKITKALAQRLAKAKDAPVSGVAFAAIDSDKLTLSSFAARAAQRDQQIKEQLGKIMERIQAWERESGHQAAVAVRPADAAVAVTAPAALFHALAEDAAVAALDVEGK
jgi:hypothetical protein